MEELSGSEAAIIAWVVILRNVIPIAVILLVNALVCRAVIKRVVRAELKRFAEELSDQPRPPSTGADRSTPNEPTKKQ